MRKLSEEKKGAIVSILGLVTGALLLFVTQALISYILHWQSQMSGQDAGNAAGKAGNGLAVLLMQDTLGIGSFCLVVILLAFSLRFLFAKWNKNLIGTTVLSLTAGLLVSVSSSFAGNLAGLRTLFGAGLGGYAGTIISDFMISLVGIPVTAAILLILIIVWLCFCSSAVFRFFANLGRRKDIPAEPEECAEDPAGASEPFGEAPEDAEQLGNGEPFGNARAGEFDGAGEPFGNAGTGEFDGAVEPFGAAEGSGAAGPAGAFESAGVNEDNGEGAADDGPSLEIVEGDGVNTTIVKELPRINHRMDPPEGLPKYKFPPLELLETYDSKKVEVSQEELTKNKNRICTTLKNYKIDVAEVKAVVGPTVTLYKVYLAPGVKIAQVRSLQDDLGVALNAEGVRVVTLSDCVGIEVANEYKNIVPLRGLLNDQTFRTTKANLPIAIGYTITQQVKVFDLTTAPHLLVAGATSMGKSVGLNVIIASLLYSKHPSELKFVFIDPKMVEFSAYSKLLKHYLAVLPTAADEEKERMNAIVKKAADAEKILKSLCIEMDSRFELMSKAGVNKLELYNDKYRDHKLSPKNGHRFLPYLVVVVDEYADLITTDGSPEVRASSKSIQTGIVRLAQKGRAAGIHVIIATQRPSVDIINGVIKSNFPTRIAFRTFSRTDSTTILDSPGAEKLIGNGDMLLSEGVRCERIQCGYISGAEIDAITDYIEDQMGYGYCYNTPYYLPEPKDDQDNSATDIGELDERFMEAARLVVSSQKASTSYLQTRLAMGFAKASRVMSQLEAKGVVGPQDGAKPRQILISDLDALDELL